MDPSQVNAYLLVNSGRRTGSRFFLQPDNENHIGRGLECRVVLTDPRCSRVHASVFRQEEGWWIRDCGSRNGTYVNGQKIDQAQLTDGNQLRVGSTTFAFHVEQHNLESQTKTSLGQTLVLDEAISPDDASQVEFSDLGDNEVTEDLVVLFQLSIRLLSCDDPDEVLQVSLDLLKDRTGASVVGFLWLDDDGNLKPKLVIPNEASRQVCPDDSLTDLISRRQHAVRFDHQVSLPAQEEDVFADSIYVPLIDQQTTVGAIHLYRKQGRFRNHDYQIARSLAIILVRSLVRARRQATLVADHQRLAESVGDTDELVGESPPIKELKSKIHRVAKASGCVLVRGESGSGKELVARALHKASTRSDRPMLSVNCAAIPTDLMESQLFGHKKGAFTSAESDHIGWFEQADSGTLFLDEIGELNLEGQAKLLRILEGYPFLPVGGTQEVSVDVRVIAATNRDLRDYVAEKKFREDLYYRLSVFELLVPPLRDRGQDIERLVDHFVDHFCKKHGRSDLHLSAEAKSRLLSYQWPGNVRQLRNVIDSAVVMADGTEILADDLGLRDTGIQLESLRIDHWERKLIKEALSRTSDHVPEAAKLLGVSRATLYRKIEDYGIKRD